MPSPVLPSPSSKPADVHPEPPELKPFQVPQPRVIAREAKAVSFCFCLFLRFAFCNLFFQEKIAKLGLKRRQEDYPTMNDVVSDWATKDEKKDSVMPGNKNVNNNNEGEAAAAKKNEDEEMKLRKQEEAASERNQKKKGPEDEKKAVKPQDLLEMKRKEEEERVKKIRANKPMPKVMKRNTYEVSPI